MCKNDIVFAVLDRLGRLRPRKGAPAFAVEQLVEPEQLMQRAQSQEDSSADEPGSADASAVSAIGSPEVAPAVEVATEETTVGVDGEAKALGSVDHAGARTEVEQCEWEGGVGRGGKKRASRKVKVKNGDGSQV